MTYLDGDVHAANLRTAEQQVAALRVRNRALADALRDLTAAVRAAEKRLDNGCGTCRDAVKTFRGARVAALRDLGDM